MTDKNTAAEVGVKLVLDSNAQSEAAHVAAGLRRIDGEAKKTATGWKETLASGARAVGGMAIGATEAAIAAAVAGGAAIVGLGVKSFESWKEADEQIRGIAGALLSIDQNSNSFENLYELGIDVKDAMEQVGIEAGVSSDKTLAAFDGIIAKGGKTVEETQKLVANMAMAGKVIPGGLDAITMGYEQIELGMVRARNPLVQLIAATGTLKGSAKAVAKEMQKLPIDKQMELAEQAVNKFSQKMKNVPLTMSQMKEGVGIVASNVFESAGKPITNALVNAFGPVHDWITKNQETLYALGERFGDGLGKAIEVGAEFAEQAWKVANDLWDEANKTFEAMFGPGMDLFTYIYENKDAWAETFGDVLKLVLQTGMFLVRVFAQIRNAIGGMLKAIGKSGILGEDTAKFIGQEEQSGQAKDIRSNVMKSREAGKGPGDIDAQREKWMASAKSSGMDMADASQQFDAVYRRAMDDHRATLESVSGAEQASMEDDAKTYAQMFALAAKNHDQGAKEYVAHFLEGNLAMQNALIKEGPKIFGDGMKEFLDTLKGMGDKDIASYLKDKMKPNLGTPSKTVFNQTFTGAINVKQDFRDQDPDRVAVVFKKEMRQMGTNRLQSRLASPFGF